MRLCFTELVLELSSALDYIEAELLGVQTDHSKRIAYLCVKMGRSAGLDDRALADLAACALLHDNALTEYIQAEHGVQRSAEAETGRFGNHCKMGERNVSGFPFFGDVRDVILYHHERADGKGPFGKTWEETSLFSRIVHLADVLDSRYHLASPDEDVESRILQYLDSMEGKLFSQEEIQLFKKSITEKELEILSSPTFHEEVRKAIPLIEKECSPKQVIRIGEVFAGIIDYKSTFTSKHSDGLARKAYHMGDYYGLAEEKKAELFLAGALHDIGKLAVDTKILEKPGKLTDEEFEQMKEHAVVTYKVLSRIGGFEEICRIAAFHHEKLNGRGYPFGYDAGQLGKYERMLGCLDIYQALREERPYKQGKSHGETMEILYRMAEEGAIDGELVKDVNKAFS